MERHVAPVEGLEEVGLQTAGALVVLAVFHQRLVVLSQHLISQFPYHPFSEQKRHPLQEFAPFFDKTLDGAQLRRLRGQDALREVVEGILLVRVERHS